MIARSQPLQFQTLAIDPKPSIPQNSPREEGILTLNLSDTDGLDFWFHKSPSSRDNSNPCNNVSLRECPGSYYEEVEDDISSEGELSHIENSNTSPFLITSSKWLECVEWMDKEEALMNSDFGSISNGEFLTPLKMGFIQI